LLFEVSYKFSKAHLDRALPLHLATDKQGTISSVGPALSARFPTITTNSQIWDYFENVLPYFEAGEDEDFARITLQIRGTNIQLDGYKWFLDGPIVYAMGFSGGGEQLSPPLTYLDYPKVPPNAGSYIEKILRTGLLDDMRDLAAAEKAARAKAQNEASNIQLIAGLLSHDLINYLSLIMSSFLKCASEAKSSVEREKISQGVAATNLSVVLCRAMMDIAGNPRALSEKCVIDVALLDIEGLLVGLLSPGTGLKLRLAAPGMEVLCDRAGLTSSLVNLIKNAAEELAGVGGDIEIKTTMSLNPSSHVELTISNTLGLTRPDQLGKLGCTSWSTKRSNSGLGIEAVRRFCNSQGWEFAIFSTPSERVVIKILAPSA